MDDKKYRVIFKGEIVDGADKEDVVKKVAAIFKMKEEKAEKLFSGKKKIIKKEAPLEKCKKVQAAFKKAGAVCQIEEIGAEPEQEQEQGQEQSPGVLQVVAKPEVDESENNPTIKKQLLLMTLFLGGFGFHKLYIGKNIQGFLSILFSWTGIPFVISIIEFLVLAIIKGEKLRKRYKAQGTKTIYILASFMAILIISAELYFIITIGIPKYIDYKTRSYRTAVIFELNSVWVGEEVYRLDHNKYTEDPSKFDFSKLTPSVTYTIDVDSDCFIAKGTHPAINYSMQIDCKGTIEKIMKKIK